MVGILSLKAVCGWCLLSLAIITALFLLIHLKRPDAAPGSAWRKWWLGNGVLALLVLGIMAAYHHNDLLQRPENPQTMALAIHLKETGAKYYGASWCQNCRQQTRLFGPSAHRLPYVECSPGGPNSVSYTHLDVYKRQAQRLGASAAHLLRHNVRTIRRSPAHGHGR